MESDLKYIKLYSNCYLTKGINRSLVSDFQRKNSKLISNDLYEVILKLKEGVSILKIKKEYGIHNKKIIDQYIKFIIEEELGFYSTKEELDLFPDIDLTFYNPSKITNAVIIQDFYDKSKINKIIVELEKLSCKDIVIVFLNSLKYDDYIDLNKLFSNTRIKSLEIFTKFSLEIRYNDYSKLDFGVLTKVYIYNSPKNEVFPFNKKHFFDIIYIDFNVLDFKFCGAVKAEYFNTNMSKILESLNHNSCLHKKISIDKEGYIRNCPSMPRHFGNIKNTTLEEALNHPDFKKYWNVNKDMIAVCKDCEFRHICTDCRAYTERTHFDDDIDLSKPLKCGYNPYTNEWAEWSTNPLKEKAIEYYGMQDLVKKDA